MTARAAALSVGMRRVCLVSAIAASAGGAAAAPWTAAGEGGVVIDWSAGAVRGKGIGPAARHAPSPTVARVGARRAAEQQARARIGAAVRALKLAAGGTVGEAADKDQEVAARLARELERAPVVAAELGTDGSAKVTIALGIEAIRQAVRGPRVVGKGDGAEEPKIWLIDAAKAKAAPAIGLALDVGGTRWDGPVIWVRDRADAPAGEVVAGVANAAATGGVLTVSGMSAPPPAGALVVVVVPEKKR